MHSLLRSRLISFMPPTSESVVQFLDSLVTRPARIETTSVLKAND